jgi:hypothetical protein
MLRMRIFKLLILFALISLNGLSQNSQSAISQNINTEQMTQNELNDLDNLVNLSLEQKEQVFEIIHGILIKNKQVQSMKLIEADKKGILQRNNKAKIDMIYDLLNGTQKPLYKKHLAAQSSSEVLLER